MSVAERPPLDFVDLIEQYLRRRVRQGNMLPATAAGQRGVLHQFASTFPARATGVGERSIERWAETFEDYAPATRQTRWSMVSKFVDWLTLERYIPVNPMRAMTAPKIPRRLPRALPSDAVGSLLAACPDTRARLIVLLMVQCGCRRAEVSGLEVGDVSFANRTITVTGKGGHQRVLPVPDEAWTVLLAHLDELGSMTGPLIRSSTTGGPLRPSTIGHYVVDWMQAAGIKATARDGVSAHALRHTMATDTLRSGAHLRDVQAALGHAHLATTEVYLPTIVTGLAEAMAGRRYGDG